MILTLIGLDGFQVGFTACVVDLAWVFTFLEDKYFFLHQHHFSQFSFPYCDMCGQLLQYHHTDHIVLSVHAFLNVMTCYHPSTSPSGSRHLIIRQHNSRYHHVILCVDRILYDYYYKSPSFVTFTILSYFHHRKMVFYQRCLT